MTSRRRKISALVTCLALTPILVDCARARERREARREGNEAEKAQKQTGEDAGLDQAEEEDPTPTGDVPGIENTKEYTIEHGGEERTYRLHVPPSYKQGKATPMV